MKKIIFFVTLMVSLLLISCEKKEDIIPLECTISFNNVNTFGGNSGSISVTIVSGNSPFEYALNGVKQSENIFNELKCGVYVVSIKDSKNQTFTKTITLVQPNELIGVVTTEDVSTYGENNGKIIIKTKGGTKPYRFTIDNINFKTDSIFLNLTPNTYNVKIIDFYGDVDTINNIRIKEPPPLQLSVTKTTNDICIGNDGSITVLVTGGVQPYLYSKDGGINYQTSNIFNNLSLGNYNIVIKDSKNTTYSLDNTSITNKISYTTTVINQICYGGNDGSLLINPDNGTPPYSYNFNNNGYQSNNEFYNLISNIYPVTIKDSNGCVVSTTITITQPPPMTISMSVSNVTNISNGKIIVNVTGGVSPYTYKLDINNYQQSNIFDNLTSGVYEVTVKDFNGCLRSTSVTISNPTTIYNIGDLKDGGVIFYLDDNKEHGLIVYTVDYSADIFQNALSVSKNLSVGGGGWKLPNKNELSILLSNSSTYGLSGEYWTITSWGAPMDGVNDYSGNSYVHYYGYLKDGVVTWKWADIYYSYKYKLIKSF